jgi:cytochrome c-type biogenesis protein CcmH/NrfF
MRRLLLILCIGCFGVMAAHGQDVTYDDVNAVAGRLYCPVCPNELLKDCMTQACVQWRDEIRVQLSEGQTPQQVIDSFVQRYGDRVVPIPHDVFLRGLSVYTPFALAGLALLLAGYTLLRWTASRSASAADPVSAPPPILNEDARARFERDLEG